MKDRQGQTYMTKMTHTFIDALVASTTKSRFAIAFEAGSKAG